MRQFKNFKRIYKNVGNQVKSHPVEPSTCMTPKQMLMAWTSGRELPDVVSSNYDDGITIDEVGYNCSNLLDGIDYMKIVNSKRKSVNDTETVVKEEVVEEVKNDETVVE